MILKLRGIQKEYPNSRGRAIRGMSLKLKKGEILALQGESGSGKSTILKIISGTETADKGRMKFRNEEVEILSHGLIREIPGIRMIDQNSTLPSNISIRNALSRRLLDYKKTWVRNRISKLSEICQLRGLLDRKMDEISGGQRQRAALALAIADEPDILLLDEAFTSLDFSLKREIQMEWIRVIKQEGISCIMVTHDPRDSLMFADRIYVMEKGKIIEKGNPKEIYSSPSNLYTAQLFGPATEIIYNDSSVYLRPEDIEISEKSGDRKGRITEKYYLGNGFLYYIESQDHIFKAYSSQEIEKKDVFIKLNVPG